MADTVIGTLAYAIVADTTQLEKGLGKANDAITKSSESMSKSARVVKAYNDLLSKTASAWDKIKTKADNFAKSDRGQRILAGGRNLLNRAGGVEGIANFVGGAARAQADRILAARQMAKDEGLSFTEISEREGLGVTEAEAIEIEKAAKAIEDANEAFRLAIQKMSVVLTPAILELAKATNYLASRLPKIAEATQSAVAPVAGDVAQRLTGARQRGAGLLGAAERAAAPHSQYNQPFTAVDENFNVLRDIRDDARERPTVAGT